MSSFNQRGRFGCGGAGNSFVYDPNLNSFNDPPNFFNHPPQPQYQTYSSIQSLVEKLCQQKHAANLSTHTHEPSRRFNFIYDDDDDDEERTIHLNEIISQLPPSIAITPVLPTIEPEDSLIIGDENLSTIPKKESDEFIKSSIEDLVPIPSESEETSDNDSECDLPFYDDSSPLDVLGGNSVTFSNPLFNANDDFTSSDDELFLNEDVQEKKFKTYSNPLFEFDDKYISSDVNPLFNEVLEDIENKDSYVSSLDEPALLVTHLSKLNEDECFDPGSDEIEACLTSDSIPPGINGANFDPEGDILLLEKLLNDDLSFPLLPKELHFERLKVIKSYIPSDFEDDYYDSEGDTIYLKSLLINDNIPNLPLRLGIILGSCGICQLGNLTAGDKVVEVEGKVFCSMGELGYR
ncbi:hypothetical protein Tco_0102958, partial [Tanacetum coccineum]